MLNEIKRNAWARFLRKFSADNQYRFATVAVSHRGKAAVTINESIPFMGVGLGRDGRQIGSINLYVGHWSPEQLNSPTVTVKQPARLLLEGENDRDGRLVIESDDGSRVEIRLDANRVEPKTLVEKLAYTLSERRGFTPGSDLDNWLEAERTVQQLESQLV